MFNAASESSTPEGLLVHDLAVAYGRGASQTTVVGGVTLEVRPGHITGIAGESGSGKSTAVLAAIGYIPPGAVLLSGEVTLNGQSVLTLDERGLRRLWATRISYVAQDAASALNPTRKVGVQLQEVLRHSLRLDRAAARSRSIELLEAVRLRDPEIALSKYPHEFSGGQLQRIAIALSIACEPELIVLDEPTTGLDVTTQSKVVAMLSDLVRTSGVAALYISHDLGLLTAIADDLVVLYAGEVVESGPTDALTREPRHPYTRALLDSLLSAATPVRPSVLAGLSPGRVVPDACPFAPRCGFNVPRCGEEHPELIALENGRTRRIRCLRTFELGPIKSRRSEAIVADPRGESSHPLLRAEHLVCTYSRRDRQSIVAVDDVSLEIGQGEIVALVGESGSGKTTIGRAIAGILRPRSGILRWDGSSLQTSAHRRTKAQRREIQIVFQNPDSSLNPRHTVGALIGRPVALFRDDVTGRHDRAKAVAQALLEVQLDPTMANRYPHQLSGGQKQRVAIARAFVARPRLVVCDEIVSGQDVSAQAGILELLRAMQRVHHTALLFISHDLAVVRSIAERVYVIRDGRIREHGPTDRIFRQPLDAYTQDLLRAVIERPESQIAGA